jgi:DNA-binding GntR family transcriptional regulator
LLGYIVNDFLIDYARSMTQSDSSSDEHSIEDAIYNQIRDAIGNQRLPPGTRLREDEMRQIFSVTRSRIRKVFSRLAYDGLVVIEPNRGASVAKPSIKDARELFEARRGIEATIVTSVSRKLSASDRRALHAHVDKERAADEERNHPEMISLSGEFHTLLAEIADNKVLSKFLGELITKESLVIQAYERPGKPSCSFHEHEHILAAIEAKETEKAVSLMSEHLTNIENRLDLDRDERPSVSLSKLFAV